MEDHARRKWRRLLRIPRIRHIVVGFLIAFVISITFLVVRINAGLKHQLETVLTGAFGRPVTVENPVLTRSLWADDIIVPGDGVIDTGPVLVLTGVRAWPNFFSLLRFDPTIEFVTVDSAILNVRYREDKGWSIKGLFPSEPAADPKLGKLLMPKTTINFDANGQVFSRTLNVSIVLGRFGDYTCRFDDHMVKGKFTFTGSEENNPVYSLTVALDSIPIMARPESLKLTTVFREASKQVSFDLTTGLRGTPARIAGALSFNESSLRSDSAFWEFGPHRGDLVAAVDDLDNKRFLLATTGTIEFAAKDLGDRFSEGTIAVDGASVTGGVKGEWEIKAKARAAGLSMSGDASVEDLTGNIDLRAALSESFRLTPAQYSGTLRFAKASARDNVIHGGDIRFTGSGRTIELTGHASRFETANGASTHGTPARSGTSGRIVRTAPEPAATAYFPDRSLRGKVRRIPGRAVELRKFKVGFDSRWELTELGGGIRVAGLDGNMIGANTPDLSVDSLDIDMQNAGLRKDGAKWRILRVTGTIDRAEGAWHRNGFRIEKAKVDLTEGARGISGRFDGHLEAFGARGDVDARLVNNDIRQAKIDVKGLDVDAVRRFRSHEYLDQLARHVRTIDIDGTAEFADATGSDPAGLRFNGKASTRRGKLAPPDAAETSDNMHALSLQTELLAPDNKQLPVMIRSASLSIDDGKSRLSIGNTPLKTDQVATRLTIDRLHYDHLKNAAKIFSPNRFTEKLNVDGVVKGTVDLDKRGEAISAELNLAGNLMLRGSPLDFSVTGHLTDKEPTLLVNVSRVSPEAILQSFADLDSTMERGVMEWRGSAGANLTVIGSWTDANIEGTLQFHDASVRFPARKILFSGINGEVPFRLQKAKLLALGELESKRLTIERLTWADFIVREIACQARFNEKSLHFDKMDYNFAEGQGRGAFVIDFPTWDKPRTAFIGKIEGCSVGIVYRTMQPFKGQLEGRAAGQLKIQTEGTEFTALDADFVIKNGILGSELLQGFQGAKQDEGNIIKSALSSLDIWYFTDATIKLEFKKNFYSAAASRAFHNFTSRNEIFADILVQGPIKPLEKFTIMEKISPFAFLQIQTVLHIERMRMYQFMDRVGKRFQ